MPSTYAHYRFGAAALGSMPADIRRTAKRFRQLYDVGLHGPDIFDYGTPVMNTRLRGLKNKLHNQSGTDFFQRACRNLRLDPAEAADAYLYGLLTHYCLDAVCRPFIKEKAGEGIASIQAIETEFDRFLLEKDGKVPPCSQDLSPHIRLTPGECETTARFYSGVNAGQIKDCVRNMAMVTRLMAAPEGARRSLLRKSFGVIAQEDKLMGSVPNPDCAHLNEELYALYTQAEALFARLLLQLNAHMTYNAALGEEFAPPFG